MPQAILNFRYAFMSGNRVFDDVSRLVVINVCESRHTHLLLSGKVAVLIKRYAVDLIPPYAQMKRRAKIEALPEGTEFGFSIESHDEVSGIKEHDSLPA